MKTSLLAGCRQLIGTQVGELSLTDVRPGRKGRARGRGRQRPPMRRSPCGGTRAYVPEDVRACVAQLEERGKGPPEIARLLGTRISFIQRHLRRAGRGGERKPGIDPQRAEP